MRLVSPADPQNLKYFFGVLIVVATKKKSRRSQTLLESRSSYVQGANRPLFVDLHPPNNETTQRQNHNPACP
jgi:hypothetical protein